ncbi:hypothetical protein [Streptomyces sp. NPDC048603]|uniref:hypothetical protein n=1 Tax=Streptomyces sp. NPDC048603 TaxID=3365577 RepID=UPI003718073D
MIQLTCTGDNMTVRDIRTAARLIGRRNALRYLAIGAGATLLAACGGKDEPPAQNANQAAGTAGTTAATPAPTTPPKKKGVLERSFEAFVTGTWQIRSTMPGGDVVQGKATVTPHSWSIAWEGGAESWEGNYRLHGSGVLAIGFLTGPKALTRENDTQAHSVPVNVGESFNLTLPWQPPGSGSTGDGQQLSAAYADNTLTIRHIERSGSTTTHTCTRA